jgi:DNA-binding transcriptional LysR family regulator
MALLAHGEQIERAVGAAVLSVSEFNREISGAITLGTGRRPAFIFTAALQQLRQAHPLLTVGVTTGNTLDIVRAVEENRLDLGLVTLPANGRSLAVIRWWMRSLCLFLPVDRMRCRWS